MRMTIIPAITENPTRMTSISCGSYWYTDNCNHAASAVTGKVCMGPTLAAYHVPNVAHEPSAAKPMTAATTAFTGFPRNVTAQKLSRNGKPIAARTESTCAEFGTK